MATIACISDTHESSPDYLSRSLFPGYIDSLEADRRDDVYRALTCVLSHCHDEVVRFLANAKQRPWDMLIHLGDVTGGWNECGIDHPSVLSLAEKALEKYKSVAHFVGICWGNHDTGYADTIGGLSVESIYACRRLSPLHWSHYREGILFLGVCSPLMSYYHGEHTNLISDLREEQLAFVAQTLASHKGMPWVLCTHDVDFSPFAKVLHPYTDTLIHVLYGDKHSPLGAKLEKVKGYLNPLSYLSFAGMCRRRGTLCPSVAPLWWHGGACITGEVLNGKLKLTINESVLSPELAAWVNDFRFSSFIKCALPYSRFKSPRMFRY